MDLTNILNKRDGAAAAASATAQSDQKPGIQKSRRLSHAREQDTRSPTPSGLASDSERSPHSPHPSTPPPAMSEHPHYQLGHPGAMNGYPVPYNPLPMLQHPQALQQAQAQYDQNVGQRAPGRPSTADSTHKAFACGTCQKAFARRSDLARHGEQYASMV